MKRFLLFLAITATFQVFPQTTIDTLKSHVSALSDDSSKAVNYLKIVYLAYNQEPDSVKTYVDRTVNFAQKAGLTKVQAQALNVLGYYYRLVGLSDSALSQFEKTLELGRKISDTSLIASAYGNLANVYADKGEYDKAIDFYRKTLNIFEKQNNIYGLATVYGALGNIYLATRKYDFARENYDKSIYLFSNLYKKTKNVDLLDYAGIGLMNKGIIFKNLKMYDSSEFYLDTAIGIFRKINDYTLLNQAYANLAEVLFNTGKYQQSVQYSWIVSDYFLQNKLYKDLIITGLQIASAYQKLEDYPKAKRTLLWLRPYFDSAQVSIKFLQAYYKLLSELYSSQNKTDSAYIALSKAYEFYDSIIKLEAEKSAEEALTKFKTEQKQKEIELLKQAKLLQQKTIKTQRLLLTLVIAGLFIVTVFALILMNLLSKLRKANSQLRELNAEITQQKEEILTQKEEIERQNRKITESINYASRIQQALLPRRRVLDNVFAENFLIYLPKEIISGDFYWFYRSQNRMYISIGDCTGHGVPGALMSMLGLSLLNEIVKSNEDKNAGQILDLLRSEIKQSLKQDDMEKYWQSKEGIDMTLLIIDLNTLEANFAGAYNSLIIVTPNHGFIEIKGDKMPVGIYLREKEHFKDHRLQLSKGDMIYMFSDGFVDQFGGPNHKKFMHKNFKKLLNKIATYPADEQYRLLLDTFEQWKNGNPQVDDVTILGLRI